MLPSGPIPCSGLEKAGQQTWKIYSLPKYLFVHILNDEK